MVLKDGDMTNSNTSSASVNPNDQISQLLMTEVFNDPRKKDDVGDQQSAQATDTTEGQTEESSGEVDEQTSTFPAEGDEEVTWGKALGIDEDKIVVDESGNIKGIVTKIGDKTETVSLAELLKGYQIDKVNTTKAQKLAEERRALDASIQAITEGYTAKLNNLEKLGQYMQKQLVGNYESIDWNALRAQNPGEYAALQADFQSKQAEIQRIFEAVSGEKLEQSKQTQAQMQAKLQQHVNEQLDLIIAHNPEWQDQEKFAAAINGMQSFVADKYGFKPEEFNQVTDARLIRLIQDAQKYHQGVTNVTQKIANKPLPKFLKPTGATVKTVSKVEKLTQAARKANGYERTKLQTGAVSALLEQEGLL